MHNKRKVVQNLGRRPSNYCSNVACFENTVTTSVTSSPSPSPSRYTSDLEFPFKKKLLFFYYKIFDQFSYRPIIGDQFSFDHFSFDQFSFSHIWPAFFNQKICCHQTCAGPNVFGLGRGPDLEKLILQFIRTTSKIVLQYSFI